MKKITTLLAAVSLIFSATVFGTVRLSAHPAKIPATGDIRGKIRQVVFSNRDNNPWVRLIIGKNDRKYAMEFEGEDIAVGNTLLDAKGKHIDALYAYSNGIYIVNFFEIT